MKFIEEILGIPPLSDVASHRLILSLFCMLTFVILFYFWNRSKIKSWGITKDVSGLLSLSFVFLFYVVLGMVSVYRPGIKFYLIVSGLINISYLLSLSFFAQGNHIIDKVVQHKLWKVGIFVIGIVWTLFVLLIERTKSGLDVDMLLSSVSFLLIGMFTTRSFVRHNLNLLGFINGFLFLFFIWLQFSSPELLGKGKFVHINTTILFPALFVMIVSISYTFNWLNEQKFRELSQIYTDSDIKEEEENPTQIDVSKDSLPEIWQKQIINDDLEKVIEGLLAFKNYKNDSLATILNIAQRNTRNNTNRIKDLIRYQEFQLNRNKISEALISLILKS